jgi:hypothetical protein
MVKIKKGHEVIDGIEWLTVFVVKLNWGSSLAVQTAGTLSHQFTSLLVLSSVENEELM